MRCKGMVKTNMRAGRLRHRLDIYLVTKSSGVSGVETLTLVFSWPCEIAPMSGKEYQALGGTSNAVTHKITGRYVHGITDAHVGMFKGRRFRFVAVLNIKERNQELQIVAVET